MAAKFKTFKIRVAWDNPEWDAHEIANHIMVETMAAEGGFYPADRPEIQKVSITYKSDQQNYRGEKIAK